MSDRIFQIAEEPDWASWRGRLLEARRSARRCSMAMSHLIYPWLDPRVRRAA